MTGESGSSIIEYLTTGFTVSANNVTIKGFTLESDPAAPPSTGTGIQASNSTNLAIKHDIFQNTNGYGIQFIGGVTSSLIADNAMTGSDGIQAANGLIIVGNTNDTLSGNTLNGGSIVLSVTATGATLTANTVENGGGFENAADNATFTGNKAFNNTEGFEEFGGNGVFSHNIANNNKDDGFRLVGYGHAERDLQYGRQQRLRVRRAS